MFSASIVSSHVDDPADEPRPKTRFLQKSRIFFRGAAGEALHGDIVGVRTTYLLRSTAPLFSLSCSKCRKSVAFNDLLARIEQLIQDSTP